MRREQDSDYVRHYLPHGPVTTNQRAFLTGARRSIIEMVRDHGKDVDKVLTVYNDSFRDLTVRQTPKTFRDFLLSAPYMFLELGEKMGAISHIVSFWCYRFPPGGPKHIDAEELAIIFQDFIGGFAERAKDDVMSFQRPHVIEA